MDVRYWLPRILGIAFIAFLSLFAFDAFTGADSIWAQLLGLIIHLLPSIILACILWLAWKQPFYGGGAFLIGSILFTLFFKTYENSIGMLLLSLPLVVVGGLFLWEGLRKKL